MRTYVVVPAGTEVSVVDASRPYHAIGKAGRKRGLRQVLTTATAFPLTALKVAPPKAPTVPANQLSLLDA